MPEEEGGSQENHVGRGIRRFRPLRGGESKSHEPVGVLQTEVGLGIPPQTQEKRRVAHAFRRMRSHIKRGGEEQPDTGGGF